MIASVSQIVVRKRLDAVRWTTGRGRWCVLRSPPMIKRTIKPSVAASSVSAAAAKSAALLVYRDAATGKLVVVRFDSRGKHERQLVTPARKVSRASKASRKRRTGAQPKKR